MKQRRKKWSERERERGRERKRKILVLVTGRQGESLNNDIICESERDYLLDTVIATFF